MKLDYDVLIARSQAWSENIMKEFYQGKSRSDEVLVDTSGEENAFRAKLNTEPYQPSGEGQATPQGVPSGISQGAEVSAANPTDG